MTSFLSTFVNKIDSKGRVSVPAPFRGSLNNELFQGIIAYPSLTEPAIDAFGRSMLEQLNRRVLDKNLEDGEFEQTLLGRSGSIIETIMALAHELPFDGQGRVILPAALIKAAGLDNQVAFVGRGNRFQIWNPGRFSEKQEEAVAKIRENLRTGLS
jgi:MraZ protein